MVEFIFRLGEIFHTHTHTHIFVAFLGKGNKKRSLNSFTSVMKKKMSSNVITRWLEEWVIQTHQVENNDNTIFDVILVSEDQIEHLRRSSKGLNLQLLCISKLQALLIKSLSNPSISLRVPHRMNIRLLFNIAVLKIFEKFPEKHLRQSSYYISSNKHPRRLLNFETVRRSLKRGAYLRPNAYLRKYSIQHICQLKGLQMC